MLDISTLILAAVPLLFYINLYSYFPPQGQVKKNSFNHRSFESQDVCHLSLLAVFCSCCNRHQWSNRIKAVAQRSWSDACNGVCLAPFRESWIPVNFSRWNNYNSGLQPDAANALNTANAFISLGLKDLGYTYINMDDGWPSMSRDSSGNLVPNPTFFPNGMLNLTTEIHSMGLKFGLYGDSGTQTCSGFPGSQGFEAQDAAQLSEWGVDYWKYDNCNTPSGDSEPRYQLMSNELAAQSHSILYSLCQWGVDSVWTWGASVGNSWRVGGDITNSWRYALFCCIHVDGHDIYLPCVP